MTMETLQPITPQQLEFQQKAQAYAFHQQQAIAAQHQAQVYQNWRNEQVIPAMKRSAAYWRNFLADNGPQAAAQAAATDQNGRLFVLISSKSNKMEWERAPGYYEEKNQLKMNIEKAAFSSRMKMACYDLT